MKVFLDFDRTLINSSAITDAVLAAYADGSADVVREHYKTYRTVHPFNVSVFGDYMQEKGFDGGRLRDLFYEQAHQAHRYLFADTIPFLQSLKEAGHERLLLTMAPDIDDWQRPKVDTSGIVPLLDDIHITSGKKIDVITTLNIGQPFIFIDDKQSEVDAMQAAFPQALCIKHEPGSPLADHLKTIERFIRNQENL